MSFTRKGDTHGWTYCDKCRGVNGDVNGQVILCKCDRAEVAKAKISDKLKKKQLKSDCISFKQTKKAKRKKKSTEVDILKYKNDYEIGY